MSREIKDESPRGSPGYYRHINRANGKALDSDGATNDSGKFRSVGSTFNQQWQFVAS